MPRGIACDHRSVTVFMEALHCYSCGIMVRLPVTWQPPRFSYRPKSADKEVWVVNDPILS